MTTEIYRSSNGDRWVLVGDTVRHEPGLASGGRITETPVDEFLDRTGESPENVVLKKLLGR
jgi:hypothetical protein